MNVSEESLKLHSKSRGKIEMISRVPAANKNDLSLAYTPGVAAPCLEIQKDISKSYELTRRWNLCLVVTDGSAVLGLGDIGPEAGMPVMEGKCVLFKEFGGVDAFPLCVKTKDVDEFVKTVYNISGSFGGVNLEDIAAPRCFEIERKLREMCDIPIFHDDQHGTAVVALAAIKNSCRLTGRRLEDITAAISGAGAAGTAVADLLLKAGVRDVIVTNSRGIVQTDLPGLGEHRKEVFAKTNRRGVSGGLADAVRGADVFFGLSAPKILTQDMVRSMAPDPIIFAMANPVPEISPEDAHEAGAFIVGTGRSDHPNQINNVLAFPGIFRGAFDVRASEINEEMKIAASDALAALVSDDELSRDRVIPEPFDERVGPAVASAVADAARRTGAARI